LQVKRLADTYLIRLEKGETVIGSLEQFADAYRIGFGVIQAIGTFQRATLGYYDPEAKSIQRKELEESVEVLSLSGNITQGEDGQHLVHAHVALGRPDYTTYGGHLVEATAGPTVEIVVETAPTTIRRRHDPDTGGQLWDLEAFEVLSV
jgi:hypothetical protein